LKGSWREDAKWLEQNFPEEYREPRTSEIANQTPTVEPQPLTNAPESPQSASAALPALPSIPCLQSPFWWALLFGNPDSPVPSSDATRALQLVSDKLGVLIADGETIDTVRAGQLRKSLRERFGHVEAEQAMAVLWRSAPATDGAPQPSEDQSQLPPGRLPLGRSQPRWIAELNEPGGVERQRLMENGLWCG
jgi:hypothetical protein